MHVLVDFSNVLFGEGPWLDHPRIECRVRVNHAWESGWDGIFPSQATETNIKIADVDSLLSGVVQRSSSSAVVFPSN